MNAKFSNFLELRRKAQQLANEASQLEKAAGDPASFAVRGEMPHADHIGWTGKTAWFYTPSAMKAELIARQQRALARIPILRAKAARAAAKARRVFVTLPWSDRASLIITGGAPE